jgi:pimeloyl-ACP methyl ester carboxylesterase
LRRRIQIGTASIAALDTDPVIDAQAAVLLVPGYTGSKEDFLPIMAPAARAGYRMVAIDQRGQFESSWSSDPLGYRIDALARDVTELAEQLADSGSQLHLVGHSFGGMVCRAAVIAKPALFTSLTLMGSGPSAISGHRHTMLQLGEPLLLEHGLEAVWDLMTRTAAADSKYSATSEQLTFLRGRFLANDPAGLLAMGRELRSATDRTEELVAAGVAVLVLHGVDDDAWPSSIQADMAEALGARHAVIPHAIHSPAVENPAGTVAALVEFWRSLGSVAQDL